LNPVRQLDWLTTRPIAHRGLHDAKTVVENTPSAFLAAIAGGYGIECDLQISADGEAMVHHDDVLGRLTDGTGRLNTVTAADLKRVAFRATSDHMITLGELCDLAADRAALVIELKSSGNGDRRLVARAAAVLSGYRGRAALMSFDPELTAVLHGMAPRLPRGIVAERGYPRANGFYAAAQRSIRYGVQVLRTRPQFIAYSVDDLPAAMPTLAKRLGLPVLAWTVRRAEQQQKAKRYADQIIFEGYRP
jgi:glycerophosphoryl diester phosphodiesterase